MSEPSKLKDIIASHRLDTLELAKSGLHSDSETIAAIKALMLEMIGEDLPLEQPYDGINWEKARLRKRVEEL